MMVTMLPWKPSTWGFYGYGTALALVGQGNTIFSAEISPDLSHLFSAGINLAQLVINTIQRIPLLTYSFVNITFP